jgi:hypothetical protein
MATNIAEVFDTLASSFEFRSGNNDPYELFSVKFLHLVANMTKLVFECKEEAQIVADDEKEVEQSSEDHASSINFDMIFVRFTEMLGTFKTIPGDLRAEVEKQGAPGAK